MLESALLALSLTFVNPADPSGKTMYPSGILGGLEWDYFNNLPDTKDPNLVIPIPVYDSDKNIIEPSIYETTYSKEERCLLLLESGTVKAKLPVDNIIILDKEYKLPYANAQRIGTHKILIIYRAGNIEVNRTLDTP